MKGAALFLLAILGGFLAGYLYRGRTSPDVKVIKHSADSLALASAATDSSLAQRQPGDSAAVAEPLHTASVHHQHAVSLGDTVAALQRRTDSLLAAAAASDSNASHAMQALADERDAQRRQMQQFQAAILAGAQAFRVVAAQLAYYRDTAVVELQRQRDKAQQLLDQALKVKPRRCGPGVMIGAGIGTRGADAGGFIGLSCVL